MPFITDGAGPDEIREALAHLNHKAKRLPHIYGAGCPTPWDTTHQAIDDLLFELEMWA